MVRIVSTKQYRDSSGEYQYIEAYGLSTDTKPEVENMCTGSTFIEVDTGSVYFFNEEGASGQEWVKVGG